MKLPFAKFFAKPARAPQPKIFGSAMPGPRLSPRQQAVAAEYAAFNQRSLRAFDAAVTTNLNPDFIPTCGSANAEWLTSGYLTRGRSRTLIKDYPTARGAVRAFKNNVVGHNPFPLEMKVGSWDETGSKFTLDERLNRKIRDEWARATLPENLTTRGDMSYMELCQLIEASSLREGGVLLRQHRNFPHNRYGYALEVIEIDRLEDAYMGRNPVTGNEIRFSIERDKWQRPVAYWILTRHPGDVFGYNTFRPDVLRERVDAADIIHFQNLRDRAEQDVGAPEFDSTIQTLHRNRQFSVAHSVAATQSAAKPWWIERTMPTGMSFAGDPAIAYNAVGGGLGAGGEAGGGGTEKIELVEPGSARVLDWGFQLKQLDPRFPIESATAFRRDNNLEVACGTGLSYGTVSSDFQQYSFSVARFSVLPERDNFMVRQEKMIVDFVRVHFNNWLNNAILSGALSLPISRYEEFCERAFFHGKRWPYIQPVQDIQADGIAMELNLESPQGILAKSEGGRSIEEVYTDIASARKMMADHGLPIPGDAELPTMKKGEPGQEDAPGKPPAEPNAPAGKSRRPAFTRQPSANGEHHEWR